MIDISVLPSGNTLLAEIVLSISGPLDSIQGEYWADCPQMLGHHAIQFSPCSLFLPLLHWPSLRGSHALFDSPLPLLF